MTLKKAGLYLTTAVALAAAHLTPTLAAAKDIVIHAGRLIDGVSNSPKNQVSILIRDDRITAIENGFVRPEGVDVIDLSSSTVLPGLIDTHVHLAFEPDGTNPIVKRVTTTEVDAAIMTTNYARRTLEAGFTAVRDVAGNTKVSAALKRAIEAGKAEGPRLWFAGAPLGPTGGHGDGHNGMDPGLAHPQWSDGVIDGPDEARKVVRLQHRLGANVIKIMPSGGVLSIGDDPRAKMMTDAEIKAVVDTAHELGMKVAAHAHGKSSIDAAIRMGVDSIEHSTWSDAESYKLYKQHGTYLVPTILVTHYGGQLARNHPEMFNPSAAQKALEVSPGIIKMTGDAYRAGVKIAFGTDTAALSPHGRNAEEFALLVKAGLTPMDAIQTATKNAADLLGASEDVGTVQTGRYADIIAVSGNPLEDITELERVKFVMKGGRTVKSEDVNKAQGE